MKLKLLFSHLLLALLLSGCGGSGDSGSSQEDSVQLEVVTDYVLDDTGSLLTELESQFQGLPLSEFYDASFKAIELRDLESVMAAGRTAEFDITDHALNNISDDYYFQTVAIKTLIRDTLLTYDRSLLSAEEKFAYDTYRTYLDYAVEEAEHRDLQYPASFGFFGWQGATESFFSEVLTITDKAEAERYLTLLNQIERRFQQIESLLDARRAAGVIEPRITLDFSRNSARAMANRSAEQTSYYQAFDEKISSLSDINSIERQQLRAELEAIVEQRVIPAYRSLEQKMASLRAEAPSNIGFGQFPGGDAYYRFTLRFFTNSEATPEQIHQLGLEEMARVHAELRELFNQLGYPPDETIPQLLARAETDGGIIPGSQAVGNYEEIIAAAYSQLPEAFNKLPQQEVVVIGGDSGGYYITGSEDGSRPGAFYAQTNTSLPYYTMPTLAYHEAVPGHHLQLTLAQELNLPRFLREMHFTSFIEGWGLYAERLAKDLGWYSDDIYGDIGRLQFEALRASRLVIDTGIHSMGWTYSEAQNYSQQTIGNPGSIARYSVWPGQAVAYLNGMLKILELRALAEDRLGDSFDLRDFHDVVLGNGSVPLNVLEDMVNNYIDGN